MSPPICAFVASTLRVPTGCCAAHSTGGVGQIEARSPDCGAGKTPCLSMELQAALFVSSSATGCSLYEVSIQEDNSLAEGLQAMVKAVAQWQHIHNFQSL